jgi:hypothetical protein
MDEFDLLSAVQPEQGWYAVVGIKGDSKQQEIVETREEFDDWVAHFVRTKRNVFFGVAKYKDGTSRAKTNVQALKAFWLDIDCGEGKDYPTQAEGLTALQQFCKTVGLPRPTTVNSGRGVHVYWALTDEITREQWEPVAKRLKEVCKAQGLLADNNCFEVARILRVPGTFNFKGTEPAPVTVVRVGKPVDYDAFRELMGVKQSEVAPRLERRVSALGALLQDSVENKFIRIIRRDGSGCRQLVSCLSEREGLSEPRWFNALAVAKFCKDRDTAIHMLSAGHPDYDPALTEQKIKHIVGPHTCEQFESNNPGGCDGCPHKGKVKSPIVLGRAAIKADEEDVIVEEPEEEGGEPVTYKPPKYPFPYFRGKNGGVWRKTQGDEALDEMVYPHDIYVVKRMFDPGEGMGVMIRFHTPYDGMIEFVIPNSKIMDGAEVRKALAFNGVMCAKKQFELLIDCIIRAAMELQSNRKAETMRTQFGWADNDSKFIIGDREISAVGTFYSPPSTATRALAEHMVPTGSFEKWKEVFNLYGRPGLEAHAFAAATAFGAPILRFSGQRGAIINIIHPNSGTGKTTILHMANSVWGDPVKLCAKKDDTFNSKVFKLGVFCNLPICFDEMTNTDPKQLSELTYLITQGTGKDRMKASANELRLNNTTWQTVALCSSNNSFYEKLEMLKDSPQGEIMRIVEFYLDYSDAIDMDVGKHMFDHQLLENYGHAGEVYAKYLLTEYDEVKKLYASIQYRLDTQLKLTQRERFWSATVAANITGIYIAIRLNLCNWDISRIFKWACNMIRALRATTRPPVDGDKQTLGEFIVSHIDNILIVNDGIDRRSKMVELPIREPKRDLIVRYEPDTAKVYIRANAFRAFCTQRSISYRETIKKMKASGVFMESIVKRMSKGMEINTPGVQALVFNANHPDFISLSELAEPTEE